jgi:hypothetical protein
MQGKIARSSETYLTFVANRAWSDFLNNISKILILCIDGLDQTLFAKIKQGTIV